MSLLRVVAARGRPLLVRQVAPSLRPSCGWCGSGEQGGWLSNKFKQIGRSTRRMYHSCGLSTFLRGAVPIAIGDILAQTIYPYLFDKKKSKKNSNMFKDINWCRTMHYAVLGGLLVGPISKKVNAIIGRRIVRYPPGAYFVRVLLIDVFLLTPVIIAAYTAGYDYKFITEHYSDKKVYETMKKRYWTPITDIALFYILTKPFTGLLCFFVIPCAFRRAVRLFYTYFFYTFLSHTVAHHKLGEEITKRKAKAGKTSAHYDGSGGFACMAVDKVTDLVKGRK